MRCRIPCYLVVAFLALAGPHAVAGPSLPQEGPAASGGTASYEAVEDLLERGRAALREGRMLGPAGDNALEYTVRALELDRDHPLAQAAMDDLYSFVTTAIDGAIERRRRDEAERLLGLLERGRPDSVVAKSLRARLARGAAVARIAAG